MPHRAKFHFHGGATTTARGDDAGALQSTGAAAAAGGRAAHACARVDVAAAQTAEELFGAGNALYDAQEYAGAWAPYLRSATEFQHAGAQFRVGWLYWSGRGRDVTANKTEGVRWYTLASAQGYDLAHANLGCAFRLGEGGLVADAGEAVRLFTLGAARGQMYGLYSLGYAHSNGQGPLTVSKPVALGFYVRAARQGHRTAQYGAAALLYNGDGGVPRDDKMAYFWALLSSRSGYERAYDELEDWQARCTGDCRTEAEALAQAFRVEDACRASRYTRQNHCGGRGTPTPE